MDDRASLQDLTDKWDSNYAGGRANAYPYDWIVGVILGRFGSVERSAVRVLDLGCGGGNHAWFLAREGFDFRAVDGAANAIALTRKRVGLEFADRVVQGDLRALKFEDGFFDAILDRQSMGHNRHDDIVRIVNKLHGLLAKDGLYIGEIFSTADADLQFAGEVIGSDYSRFKQGKFRFSPLVHAFKIEELKDLFVNFVIERLHRCADIDELQMGKRSEVFRIIARRRA